MKKIRLPVMPSDPKQFALNVLLFVLLAFLVIGVIYFAGATAKEGIDTFFPNAERERQAFEQFKIRQEAFYLPSITKSKAQSLISLERAKVEAERVRLGLEPLDAKQDYANSGVQLLDDLGRVLANYLLPIGVIWLMFLVSQGFAAHHRPWILALHTSLLIVLLGGFALLYGATADTSLRLKWFEIFITFNTASIGIVLIALGTALSSFSLWIVSRSARSDK